MHDERNCVTCCFADKTRPHWRKEAIANINPGRFPTFLFAVDNGAISSCSMLLLNFVSEFHRCTFGHEREYESVNNHFVVGIIRENVM